jgi:hypothetical protein
MQLYEYKSLSEYDKAQELWSKGHCIASARLGKSSFALYALENFYVEIELVEEQSIQELVCFKKGIRLDKYLSGINIDDLFNR